MEIAVRVLFLGGALVEIMACVCWGAAGGMVEMVSRVCWWGSFSFFVRIETMPPL